jgi:L-methionine (R)-S-oxide reductase
LISAKALVEEQDNWVTNTANVASLLWHMYKSINGPLKYVNWTGFYVKDPKKDNELILGPFHGKVACQSIKIGTGVCGTAAATKETQVVPDVDKFPGHIACDGETKSEIVIPIVDNRGVVRGVIDIDCEEPDAFDDIDKKNLETLADILNEYCKW